MEYKSRRINNGLPLLPENSFLISDLIGHELFLGYAIDKSANVWTCKEHNFKDNLFKNEWRKLKVKTNPKQGYLFVCMSAYKGENKTTTIHRLLSLAFIPNHNNYPCVNHKDGNKLNNSLDNLEWCTHKHNSVHCIEKGLRNTAKGERIPNSFLKEQDIKDIFSLKKNGLLNREISEIYNIDMSAISRILNKKSWAHVTT